MLEERIVDLFHEHKEDYGRIRLKKALAKENIQTSEYTISKILKKHNLLAKRGKRRKYPYKKSEQDIIKENLILGKDTTKLTKNELWVSDITEFRCKHGQKLFLTTILEVATRKIIGFYLSNHVRHEVVKNCLEQAITLTQTTPKIFHSDRGSQYTSKAIHEYLKEKNIQISMSRPAKPSDNPHIESLWNTIKLELGSLSNYSILEAKKKIVEEIYYYNYKRMHSAIEYKTPTEKYCEDSYLL